MVVKKKKPSVSSIVAAEVCYQSDHRCCVCGIYGGQIHHLVPNDDNSFDNLAFLCHQHHDDATRSQTLTRKLSAKEILMYRKQHYAKIEAMRKSGIAKFDSPIDQLTEEALLITVKNALIILKIEETKEAFFNAALEDRSAVLDTLTKYSDHTNSRVTFAVLVFLERIVSYHGMGEDVAASIFSLIIDFCYNFTGKEERTLEIWKMCLEIGYSMVYDATVKLNDFDVAMYGLTIIKYVYRSAKEDNIEYLLTEVSKTYSEIERTLQRPERPDLATSLELIASFKSDLECHGLAFPVLPKHLMDIIYKQRAK